jgi:hypothetical protein
VVTYEPGDVPEPVTVPVRAPSPQPYQYASLMEPAPPTYQISMVPG